MVRKVLALYVPVLHQGYLNLFRKTMFDVEGVYLFGKELVGEFASLEREIRAIEPEFMARLVMACGFFKRVDILTPSNLSEIAGFRIITADEGISRRLAGKYLSGCEVFFENVFLRWDESCVVSERPVRFSAVSADRFDRQMMALARSRAEKSSDWWRRVGAVLVKNGQVALTAFNQHLPSEHSPYVVGDVRDLIKPGEHSDISSAIHSEKAIIALAANQGIALAGADLYVNVFPCSDCAKSIAFSGIKRCFFGGGCANFHGEDVLKFFGVELIYVE